MWVGGEKRKQGGKQMSDALKFCAVLFDPMSEKPPRLANSPGGSWSHPFPLMLLCLSTGLSDISLRTPEWEEVNVGVGMGSCPS